LSNALAQFITYPSAPGRIYIHPKTKEVETHEPSMVSLHMAHAMCVQLGLPYDHADENSKEKAVTTQVKEKKEQYKQVASARTTINNRE